MNRAIKYFSGLIIVYLFYQKQLIMKQIFSAFFAFCVILTSAKAQHPKDLYAKISVAADKIEPQTVAWRRDFHEHPELGNREFRTSKIIADYLRSLGLEVKDSVGKTGVVGILRGQIWMACPLQKERMFRLHQK